MSIKNKIALITAQNSSNTAHSNRLKCMAEGFCANGYHVSIYSLSGSDDIKESYKNTKVSYISFRTLRNKYIRFIINFFKLLFTFNKFDVLFLSFTNPLLLFPFYLVKNKTIFIHERTELPSLTQKGLKYNIYLFLCRKMDYILVISNSLKNYFIQNGFNKESVILFPMLINPNRFSGKTSSCLYEFEYFAYCGNMGSNKDGLFDLIKAFSIFVKKNNYYKLVLIGGTSNIEEYNSIVKYVNSLSLTENIVFTGRVDADEVPLLLSNAKVLLLARPSNVQAKFGFPTKLGEYLATSKPVLVTDTGDISFYLKNNESCYIVEPDNATLFADKLDFIIKNYDEALKVAKNGNCKIYNDFNYIFQCRILLNKINKKNKKYG